MFRSPFLATYTYFVPAGVWSGHWTGMSEACTEAKHDAGGERSTDGTAAAAAEGV